MPKRKAAELDTEPPALRRSARRTAQPAAAAADEQVDTGNNNNKISNKSNKAKTASSSSSKSKSQKSTISPNSPKLKTSPKDEQTDVVPAQPSQTKENKRHKAVKPVNKKSSPSSSANVKNGDEHDNAETSAAAPERWYWLLKAEPETRFENGVDVRFSIDDLASKTEPEPWDGIRSYAARNNLRAMKKGELAFFYHSNCKEPGLVGTMEIVQEHSPDLSAHDPKAPYYDSSSKPEDPKWSVVHVKFRSKFVRQVGLKELKEMGKTGQPLENMQMLKQSRLSVSRVSPAEWDYLMDLVERQGGEVSEAIAS